jgi:hypothetical protein
MSSLGRTMMLFGVILLVVGALMTVVGRLPRLPGDILIRRDSLVIYIPLATSLVLSLLLTVILSLLARR